MNEVELLVRGALAGLAITAPVGPVNVLCISRTLAKGRMAGLRSGFGAATADTVYGSIAGFSISFIIQFLVREQFWIRLVGGALLIMIGIRYYFKTPQSLTKDREESAHSDYITAFLLTLTNPTVVLSFLAVLAVLGLAERRALGPSLVLVGGIFAGAMLWWIALAFGVSHFRDRFNDTAVLWMNRIAGVAIGGFGIATLALSRWHAK